MLDLRSNLRIVLTEERARRFIEHNETRRLWRRNIHMCPVLAIGRAGK